MSQPPLTQARSPPRGQFHPKPLYVLSVSVLNFGLQPPGRARPSHHQAAHHLGLQVDLLGYGERVVYLDAEIAHRAFQLCVPEKQPPNPPFDRTNSLLFVR